MNATDTAALNQLHAERDAALDRDAQHRLTALEREVATLLRDQRERLWTALDLAILDGDTYGADLTRRVLIALDTTGGA